MEIFKKEIDYVKIGSAEVSLDRMKSLINALETCNGHTKAIMIDEKELKDELETKKIIKTTIRGGSYPGEKFEEFKTKILN